MMRCFLYLVLLMMGHSKYYSQSDVVVHLPSEASGTVQLDISAFDHAVAEESGYEHLSVFVKNETQKSAPIAIQGRHRVKGDYLIFEPYFPFEKGMTYVVKAEHADEDQGHTYHSFHLGEKPAVDTARLNAIYPSSSQLPENLLRFYFYFDTPMKQGEAVKHIHLIDENGQVDDRAFMEFKQELWSPDGKRLTLLFDPGRIKRGVSTNLELGPALVEGKHYELVVSSSWKDVYGQELGRRITKEFSVTSAYRTHMQIEELVIHKPAAHSRDALAMDFDRIMDHALIRSMIRVENDDQDVIAGDWDISEDERTIRFTPEKDWNKGSYRIIMSSSLEDVSGNNLDNLLDHRSEGDRQQDFQEVSRMFKI